MQATQQPITLKEVYNLRNLGLNPELFKFGSITFESSKYICVKDQAVSNHPPFTKNELFWRVKNYYKI